MKQSSIEWLVKQLENHNGVTRAGFEKCIQQAKAMHKQEIENAWNDGAYGGGQFTTTYDTSEQYYNETFNTNQENLQDSTNGYTYYPQENKTVFNTQEK